MNKRERFTSSKTLRHKRSVHFPKGFGGKKTIKLKFTNPSLFQKTIEEKLPFKKLLGLSFIFSLGTIIIPLLVKNNLPPEIPLFYGLPEGNSQIASSSKLSIPGVISLIVFFINSTLAYFTKNSFLQKTLLVTAFTVSLFSLITVLKIILLIGSF